MSTDGFAAIEDPADAQLLGPPTDQPPAPPASVFAAVQQHWAEQAGTWRYDVEVAGSGGLLVLRMGPIETRELAVLLDRASGSKDPISGFNANADMLIKGCTAVLARDHPDGEPSAPDGQLYRIDHNLAAALGMQEDTKARQVLLRIYSGVPSPDIAIGFAVDGYVDWLRGANEELGEQLVGESHAGT